MYTILFVVTVFAGPTQVAVSTQQFGSFESRDLCTVVSESLDRTVIVKEFGKSYWSIVKSQHAECVYTRGK